MQPVDADRRAVLTAVYERLNGPEFDAVRSRSGGFLNKIRELVAEAMEEGENFQKESLLNQVIQGFIDFWTKELGDDERV